MEHIIKYVIFAITDIFFNFSIHLIFLSLFKKCKYKYTSTRFILTYLCVYLVGVISIVIDAPSILNIIITLICYFAVSTLYAPKIIHKILVTLLILLVDLSTELFAAYAVLFTNPNISLSDDSAYCIALILQRILILLLAYIFFRYKQSINLSKNTTLFWPVIFFITACSFFLLTYIYFVNEKYNLKYKALIFVYIFAVIFINLIIYYLYDRQCRDFLLHKKISELHNEIMVQEAKNVESSKYINEISKIKHNIQNKNLSIIAYINSGKYEQALEQLTKDSDYLKSLSPVLLENCNDQVIEKILTYKINYARNSKVNVDISCNIVTSTSCEYDDLSILIGNTVDNAVEYLHSNKHLSQDIFISIEYKSNILFYRIKNSVDKLIDIPSTMIIPSSKQKNRTGFGLSSIQHISEKYDGSINISCESNMFIFEATLFC